MDNLLTIIIPTYNRSNGLKELLASIYNHNLDKKMNLEVIVSDDTFKVRIAMNNADGTPYENWDYRIYYGQNNPNAAAGRSDRGEE